jgi:hypothetical protein
VSWDRLGKVLACRPCGRRFGVSTEGKAVALAEAPGGKWVEAAKVRARVRRRRTRRLAAAAVVVCAVVFPALGFAGWKAVRPTAPAAGEAELPAALEARAELFARGWLGNDVRLMQRLTSPAHDKVLYSWYTRRRPPAALRGPSDGSWPEGTRFEVKPQPGNPGQSVVRVRVSPPADGPSHPPVELSLLWEERADGWYFLPPAR